MEHKRTTNDLIQAVGTWADRNFAYRGGHWGILEEVGEAAHCILKRAQMIRGFEDEPFFRDHLKDCFADAMIYLADYSYTHRAFFAFNRNQTTGVLRQAIDAAPAYPEEKIVMSVLITIVSMMTYAAGEAEELPPIEIQVYNMLCQRLCTQMELWAHYHNFDLEAITWETWDSIVSKRDWKAKPAAGV